MMWWNQRLLLVYLWWNGMLNHSQTTTTMMVMAQFGIAGNRRQQGAVGTRFQDLQKLAQDQHPTPTNGGGGGGDAGYGGGRGRAISLDSLTSGGGGGGGRSASTGSQDGDDQLNTLNRLLEEALQDPSAMKQYEAAMSELSKMSPDEIQKQMQEALQVLTKGDVMDHVLKQKEQVLANLQASGLVPPEEVEKYRSDPAYFELKMRESFGQMQEIFANPDYLQLATETMKGMADVMKDPTKAMEGLQGMLGALFKSGGSEGGIWDNDEKIEEARLDFIKGDYLTKDPMLGELWNTPAMQEVLHDPVQFRKAVKEGFQQLTGAEGLGLDGLGTGTAKGVGKEEL